MSEMFPDPKNELSQLADIFNQQCLHDDFDAVRFTQVVEDTLPPSTNDPREKHCYIDDHEL